MASKLDKIKVVELAVEDLIPADYNPRKISPAKKQQLRKSIAKFGFTEPVVINQYPGRENVIVGGHQRIQIAKDLGMTTVPCVLVNLDLAAEKELNVRLNDGGEFDFSLLQVNFEGDLLSDLGFAALVIDEEFTQFDSKMGRQRSHETVTGRHDFITGEVDAHSKEAGYIRRHKGIIFSLGSFRIKIHVDDYFDWEKRIKEVAGADPIKQATHLAQLLGIVEMKDSKYLTEDKVKFDGGKVK